MSTDLHEDLKNIVPLDFDSTKTIPESYAWLNSDKELPVRDETVPLVDLKDPGAAKQMGHACETWGLFQVINHGVPLDLLEQVESEARKLFCLPLEQKMKVLRTPEANAGYGLASISKFFDKKMWYKGFTILSSSALHDHAKFLWPDAYQPFCEVMEECQRKIQELITTLLTIFLNILNVTDDKISSILSPNGTNILGALQLNSYPPCPNPDRVMGLAPHTDTSLFTILHQSSIGGLQAFKEELGCWVAVKPLDGALVVNVGDILHILSNARFHNVVHRVTMKEPKHRISVAYFHTVNPDFPLSPLVLRDGEVPLFRSLMAKEYLEMKGKNPEKAISMIKN